MRQYDGAIRKSKTYELTVIALFVSVIAVCSWISIPLVVPFTMQTFAIFLTVGLLGGRRGTAAIAIYLLLGILGAPVFAGFEGGPGRLLGPTGGYIIGFVFTALIMWGVETLIGRTIPALAVAMIAGLLVCYAFGTVWYITVFMNANKSVGVLSALGVCVIPFVVPDIIKIILACDLTRRLRNMV